MSLATLMLEAQKKGKDYSEVYYSIPGTLESYMDMIRSSLRKEPPAEFGTVDEEGWSLSIEGMMGKAPNKIYVSNFNERDEKGTPRSFSAEVSFSEEGTVIFSNITEVEFEMVVKAKNEMRQIEEKAKESTKLKEFSDTYDATFELSEMSYHGKDGKMKKKKRKGKVEMAQRADVKNGNKRIYTSEALKDAVESAKEQIVDKKSPLLMDSQHRVDSNGKPISDLREMVATINTIEFDEDSGVVSLDDISFIENQAGEDILALLDAGAKLEVSQRGYGTSKIEKDDDGDTVEIVEFVRFRGFDFVPSGDASVSGAEFVLEGKKKETEPDSQKGDDNVGDKVETKEPTIDFSKFSESLKNTISEQLTKFEEGLNLDKLDEDVLNKLPDQFKQIGESQKNDILTAIDAIFAKAKEEADEGNEEAGNMAKAWEGLKKEVSIELEQGKENQDKLIKTISSLQRGLDIEDLKKVAENALRNKLNSEDYERFSDSQKDLIVENIDAETIYESVDDVRNEAEVAKALSPTFKNEVDRIDKVIAASKLDGIGFPTDGVGIVNPQGGITHVQITNENVPGAEFINKLTEEIRDKMSPFLAKDEWYMPDNHEGMKHLDSMMEGFYRNNYYDLLNEANEEVTQSDIGTRSATIAAAVIPVAWRAITAFQVCELGTMTRRIEDHNISIWNPSNIDEGDVADQFSQIQVAEDADLPMAGIQYLPFPIVSSRQALRTKLTSHALATAQNTPAQPLIDSLAGLALDIRNRMDRMLWWLHITRALEHDTNEVTSWETLTRVGTSNEYKSVNQGWLPYEWKKTYDSSSNLTKNNPTGNKLEKLTPNSGDATQSNTDTEGISVQNSDGDDFEYGTHYTINYPDGSITLTDAGVTRKSNHNMQAKYTHSTNMVEWSIVPPAGTTLFDHLLNLRRAVGKAKVRIQERNYMANFQAWHVDTEDLITNGPQYTNLGGNPSDILDRLNNISSFSGMSPIKSTAIPKDYIIVAMRGSVCHKVQVPWKLEGPLTNWDDGNKFYLAEQFSASDGIVTDKLCLVGITNLNTVAE